jgi:hypothetical protein
MSPNETLETNKAAAAAGEPAVSPEALVEQLRTIRRQIPEYVQLDAVDTRAIQSVANVHREFAQAALSAIGTSPIVQSAVGSTPEELQRETELAARWALVEDELRAMLHGVASANLRRRHRVGDAALTAYSLSKRLARKPEHADLLPHLQTMRKANRFGRRKSKPQPVVVVAEPQA